MYIPIISIGNSMGIRLPKSILSQCEIKEGVELEVQNKEIILKPRKNLRKNWAKKFQKMHDTEEDDMVLPDNLEMANIDWEW